MITYEQQNSSNIMNNVPEEHFLLASSTKTYNKQSNFLEHKQGPKSIYITYGNSFNHVPRSDQRN